MGQHTSRHAVEHSTPMSPTILSQLSPSQAWPRWASSLTQGLPPEGDRGLFRGEFILVQAPLAGTIGRREDTHPRVANLFRHNFRSHTIALPGTSSPGSLPQIRRQGVATSFGHYDNKSASRDGGPVHLTIPQNRGFTKSLKPELGHITEEEEDVVSEDINQREDMEKRATHHNMGNEVGVGGRSLYRHDEDDDDDDDGENYNENEVSVSINDKKGSVNKNLSVSADEGVPYHYFASNLVKPFLVTSQRYGSFQTMTTRYKTLFNLPRLNVRSSNQTSTLPRSTKNQINPRATKIIEKSASKSRKNGVTTLPMDNAFKDLYHHHDVTDRAVNLSYSHLPRHWNTQLVPPDYEPYGDYTEIPTYHSTTKIYDNSRPPSPVQDYSSSESGISDDYGFTSKNGKKSSSRGSEARKTSSSDDSASLYKRRKSSSADSALKDFDLISSFSSDNDDERGDDVFKRQIRSKTKGSQSSRGTTTRSVVRRVSDSSTNSTVSNRRSKMRNSLRRAGKGKKGKTEEIQIGNELLRKSSDTISEDVADTIVMKREKQTYETAKTLHSENSWPQLKSCLVSDDTTEITLEDALHNDSFMGTNEMRRRSLPYRDISLDSDYGDLNRTGRSSRSASHKSVAFADETLDTSVADTSEKNISKSLADIINTSLTDGTYSSRKLSRSKSTPAEESHEKFSSNASNQISGTVGEGQKGQVKNSQSPFVLNKPLASLKTARSNSADSFLSSPNCTDKIKKLQNILIKQALPFARPLDKLLSQSNRPNMADMATHDGQTVEENTYDSIQNYTSSSVRSEEIKQHKRNSKSDSDLLGDHKPLDNLLAHNKSLSDMVDGHVSSLITRSPPATAASINMSSVYEIPTPVLPSLPPPPPPPPPAPPLPDFFNKGVTLTRTRSVAKVDVQLGERQPQNLQH